MENNIIYYGKDQFLIINACLGISAYILLSLLFLSLSEKKLNEIWKSFSFALLVFTLFNLLRILILMIIYIEFGIQTFNSVHLIFYEGLTGILTGIIYVFFYKQSNFKSKPIFSDLKQIFSEFSK